jgi:hypothetical protein
LQWLHDSSHINAANLNNVGHETIRHFRNKKGEYVEGKINDLQVKRTRIFEICIEAYMNVGTVTSLELSKRWEG